MPAPFGWISPAGAAGRLSTFIFHRVLPEPDPLLPDEPDAARFDQIVGFLSRHFTLLTASDAVQALARGTLPAAAGCITFDDGYADNQEVAARVLQRHGAPATFFVTTRYIDGGRMWNDTVIEAVRVWPEGEADWTELGLGRHSLGSPATRVAAYGHVLRALKHRAPEQRREQADELGRRAALSAKSRLMMTRAQVRALQDAGFEVGGHTMTHPILSVLDEASALREIAGGREELAAWLGRAPATFAYPNGVPGQDFGEREVALVRRAGFAGAFTTERGTAAVGVDRYRIPRFTPWDRKITRFGARLALQLMGDRWSRGRPATA